MKQDLTGAMPTLYIPHGGGPCFFMDWTLGPADTWDKMEGWLRGLAASLPRRPKAIVVFSAHWEENKVGITSGSAPPLIYDYYGFPPHTYELTYPAPGEPALAGKILGLLDEAGISGYLDSKRGFDHGVFIPFLLIYPEADVPIVQVSLKSSLDATEHLALGAALKPLRDDDFLLVGSGMSFHNMDILMRGGDAHQSSEQFDAWLIEACEAAAPERNRALGDWQSAPAARQAHPREEHLLPLMVIAGAAGEDRGKLIYSDRVLGATVSAFRFG